MLALVVPIHDENWDPDFAASYVEWRLSSLVDSIDNGEEVAALISDLGLTFSLQAVEAFRIERCTDRSDSHDREVNFIWRKRYEDSLTTPSLFSRASYLRPSVTEWVWSPGPHGLYFLRPRILLH